MACETGSAAGNLADSVDPHDKKVPRTQTKGLAVESDCEPVNDSVTESLVADEHGLLDSRIADFADTVSEHDFISAVRWMECQFPEKHKLGESVRIADDVLRLSQHVSLAFQGPALHALTGGSGKHAYRLYCNFLGLLGTNGPLPLHYSEYANQRARHHRDPTFREFIDLFNHRLLSLFYRATAEFDPVINMDRIASNNFDAFVGALGGYMPDASKARDAIPDHAKRFHVAWLGSKSKSPDGIESLVKSYFELPVEVSEFVGDWLSLPPDALIALGDRDNRAMLGISTYIGRRVWSIAHKFVLSIGPLSWQDFLSFKPGGERARSLYDLVRNYVGDEWDWDLQLIMKQGEIGALTLDRRRALGFNTWLTATQSHNIPQQRVSLNCKSICTVHRAASEPSRVRKSL